MLNIKKRGDSRLLHVLAITGGALVFTAGVVATGGAQQCCATATNPQGIEVTACRVDECPDGYGCDGKITTTPKWKLTAICVPPENGLHIFGL